jgi:glycosyltransferase involved in cell wall biosynthesis
MTESVYITFDNVDPNSGAGKVCFHEINALKSLSNLFVLSQPDLKHINEIYGFNPFLNDYFASRVLPKNVHVDLLHLSCSPGTAILDRLKPEKYVVNIVAHDLKTSVEEHEKYYGKNSYPFKHNTDTFLHEHLLKHAQDADMIITPSSSAKKWIEENIRKDRITVIPHGCDIPASYKPQPDNLVVGYLGAFGPDKGLPYLYTAYKELGWIGTDSVMLWGGTCSEFAQRNFQGTKTTGWLNDVADFYNQISVYVQPSITEGFGIEILEAMAYGRPVIATSGTAGPDVITDGVDGFVVKPGNFVELMQKLKFFKDNPQAIKEMGFRASQKAKQYTWEIVEQRYKKMYAEVLGC